MLAGFGLGYLLEDQVQPYLDDRTLIRVLEDLLWRVAEFCDQMDGAMAFAWGCLTGFLARADNPATEADLAEIKSGQ